MEPGISYNIIKEIILFYNSIIDIEDEETANQTFTQEKKQNDTSTMPTPNSNTQGARRKIIGAKTKYLW